MSYDRRKSNPGKRERLAGNRHKRGKTWSDSQGRWIKVGSRHFSRTIKTYLAVADSRNVCKRARVRVCP